MRRFVQVASTALITAGLVVLLDVGVTLAWSEPISTLDGWLAQRGAREELAGLEDRFADRVVTVDGRVDPAKIAQRAAELEAETSEGDAIGRILIPAIDLNIVLIEGTETASLQRGPGHYPRTSLPGQPGTVAIAGHRTTYLAPFRHLDRIEKGDEVLLEMPYATFTYEFESQQIVAPTETRVVRDTDRDRVVLTACNPIYSAAERIVVTANQVDVDPRGGDSKERVGGGSRAVADEIDSPGLGPAFAAVAGLGIIVLLMWFLPGSRRLRPE